MQDTAAGTLDTAIQSMLYLKGVAMCMQRYQPAGRHASGVKRLKYSSQPVATDGKSPCLQPASLSGPLGPFPQRMHPEATFLPDTPHFSSAAAVGWPKGSTAYQAGL